MLKLIPCCILFVLAQSLISFILFKKVAVKEVYFQITQFKMIIFKINLFVCWNYREDLMRLKHFQNSHCYSDMLIM